MASLSAAHRRYVAIETAISTVFNTAVSVPFAFLAAGGRPAMPLWGGVTGMAFDFVPTAFMITLVTALIVTVTARKRIGAGKVVALGPGEGGGFARLPEHLAARAFSTAAVCALVAVPLSVGVLALLGVHEMATGTFVVFKALYGAGMSVAVTPAIARAALCPRVAQP